MRGLLIALLFIGVSDGASAQEQDKKLSIEINAAQATDAGCNLSFLVTNDLGTTVDSVVFETVLFDQNGQVSQLSLFDFGALPAGKPRVRQFLLGNTTCDSISRVLFNGAKSCEGSDLSPTVCEGALAVSSRTDLEVLG